MFLLFFMWLGCQPLVEGPRDQVEMPVEVCDDGIDNDDDGKMDCEDSSCTCPEACDDLVDNDDDGRIDCADPDCYSTCPEICGDLLDNDADGLSDCADDDCIGLCDIDGDGFIDIALGGDDCDDGDDTIHPDRIEICNGIDDDCDHLVDHEDGDLDETSTLAWYADFDLDGFGDDDVVDMRCEEPFLPSSLVGGDCNDADPNIHPDMPETCNGIDDDCDTLVDGDDPDTDLIAAPTWYADVDLDGWGDPADGVQSCDAIAGRVQNHVDCNDGDPDAGQSGPWLEDADGDGYGAGTERTNVGCNQPAPGWVASILGTDCDAEDDAVHPGALEVCGDLIDQDCDGLDLDCPSTWFDFAADTSAWTRDYYFRANIFENENGDWIDAFEMQLDLDKDCEVDFYVLESSVAGPPWTTLFAETLILSDLDFHQSPPIGLQLTPGMFYALGAAWNCSATYYGDASSSTGISTPIGVFQGTSWDNAYPGFSNAYSPTSIGTGTSYYARYAYH